MPRNMQQHQTPKRTPERSKTRKERISNKGKSTKGEDAQNTRNLNNLKVGSLSQPPVLIWLTHSISTKVYTDRQKVQGNDNHAAVSVPLPPCLEFQLEAVVLMTKNNDR
ncbi:unnamed protein product [Ectocarpus sp. 12 AP-2014]